MNVLLSFLIGLVTGGVVGAVAICLCRLSGEEARREKTRRP